MLPHDIYTCPSTTVIFAPCRTSALFWIILIDFGGSEIQEICVSLRRGSRLGHVVLLLAFKVGGSSTLLCHAQYVVLLSAFYEDYTLVRILIVDRGRRRAVG